MSPPSRITRNRENRVNRERARCIKRAKSINWWANSFLHVARTATATVRSAEAVYEYSLIYAGPARRAAWRSMRGCTNQDQALAYRISKHHPLVPDAPIAASPCPSHAQPTPRHVHLLRPPVFLLGLALATTSCGGGDTGPSGTTAPNNTATSITIAPSSEFSIVSGNTTTFTASATARDGHVISNPSITWTSSSPAVAVMSGAQLTAVKVGTATITATSGSATASVSVNVTPGAVRQLAIRTQPTGAVVGLPFATQPVLEMQDAAGNLVSSSTTTVTAVLASGGGTLSGTANVAAVGGVVTFTDLRVNGNVGSRTLGFVAGTLTATTTPFTVGPPPTPFIGVDSTAVTITFQRGAAVPSRTINITNVGSQPLVGMSVDVAYDPGQQAGWLQTTLSAPNAPATLTLKIDTTGVAEGTYHATVHIAGPGAPNSPLSLGVTLTIIPGYTIGYGTSAEKVRVLDIGGTFAPTLAILDLKGSPFPGITPTFMSRAGTVATVSADGQITAVGGGDAWIVASTSATADSVFVVVPRSATGPVIRSEATTFSTRVGDTLFANIIFDTRATTVGAASLAVEFSLQSGSLSFFYNVPTSTPTPVVNLSLTNVFRISLGAATGMTGPIRVLNLKIVGRSVNTVGWLNLFALDVSDVDGSSLTAQSSSTRLPFVIR